MSKDVHNAKSPKQMYINQKHPLQHFNTPVEEGPFQYVLMDLIMDLPKSQGFNSILTIIDQGYSKAAKFIPCTKMIHGTGIALEYLKHLVLQKWQLARTTRSDHSMCCQCTECASIPYICRQSAWSRSRYST